MISAAFFNRSLDLRRAGPAKSPSGAMVQSFVAYLSGVAFAVYPAADAVVRTYSSRDDQVDYTLYTYAALPPGTVRIDDVAADPATGERFKVLAVKRYGSRATFAGTVLTELHCTTLDD